MVEVVARLRAWVARVPPWILLPLLAALAFGNTLENDWHFDDHHSILENENLRSFRHLGRFFTDPTTFSGREGSAVMYRPFLLVNYAVNYAFAGYSLPWWHVAQVALHAACALAVYALLLRVFRRRSVALFGAALWTVHPLQAHAVNYLCSRSEIQVSLLYALSVVWYADAAEAQDQGRPARRLQAASLAAAVGALGSKDMAFTLPAAMVLWDLWLGPASRDGDLRRVAWRVAPSAALVAAYLVLRRVVLGTVSFPDPVADSGLTLRVFEDHPTTLLVGTAGGRSIATNLLVQATVFWRYLVLFLWPPALSLVHDADLAPSLFQWPACATVPAVVLLLGGALAARRRWPVASFSVLFYVLVMAPTSVLPLNLVMNEHRIYLASATLFGLVAAAAARALERRGRADALVLVAAALLGVTVPATWWRNGFWLSDLTLFEDAVQKAPLSRYAQWELALALHREGFKDQAALHYEQSFLLYPRLVPKQLATRAVVLADLGNVQVPVGYLRAAMREAPDELSVLFAHAFLLTKCHLPGEALRVVDRALSLFPGDAKLLEARRSVEATLARLRGELARATVAVSAQPRDPKARLELAMAYDELGERPEALARLDALLAEAPNVLDAWVLKGRIPLRAQRFAEAIGPLRRAAAMRCDHAGLLSDLAVAYGGTGDWEEARRIVRSAMQLGLQPSFDARCLARLPPYGDPPPWWGEGRVVAE